MPSYLAYWTGVAKVGRYEFASGEYNEINNVYNISAKRECVVNLVCINAQGYKLLKPDAFFDDGTVLQGKDSFSVFETSTSLLSSTISCEASVSSATSVLLTLNLDDSDEGKHFTVKGNLYPENMPQLKDESYYEFDFIQNSPPDEVENLNNPLQRYPGTEKLYMSFSVPNRSLNRNQDIKYKVKYYLKEENGNYTFKGSKILTENDNKEGASSSLFRYYFDEQVDDFRYDYSVTVIDSTGLESPLRSTAPALGVCRVSDPDFTADYPLYEEDGGIEYYEIPETASGLTVNIENITEGALLKTVIDGTVFNGDVTGNILPLGLHTVETEVKKPGCLSKTTVRNIHVVTLYKPSLTSTRGSFKESQTNGYDLWHFSYLSYTDMDYSLVTASVNDDSVMTVTVDGNEASDSGNLEIGLHTVTVSVTKPHCSPYQKTYELNVQIKPVTFKMSSGFSIDAHASDTGGGAEYTGEIKFYLNGTYKCTLLSWYNHEISEDSQSYHSFDNIESTNVYLTKLDDSVTLEWSNWQEEDSGSNGNDIYSNPSVTVSLEYLKGKTSFTEQKSKDFDSDDYIVFKNLNYTLSN